MKSKKRVLPHQLLIMILVLVVLPLLGMLQMTGFAGVSAGSQGVSPLNILILGAALVFIIALLSEAEPVLTAASMPVSNSHVIFIAVASTAVAVTCVIAALFLFTNISFPSFGGLSFGSGAGEAAKFYSYDTQAFMFININDQVRQFMLAQGSTTPIPIEVQWISTNEDIKLIKLSTAPSLPIIESLTDSYNFDEMTLTTSQHGVLIHGQKTRPVYNYYDSNYRQDVASTTSGATTTARTCYAIEGIDVGDSCDAGGSYYEDAAVDNSHYAYGSSGYTFCLAGSGSCKITIDLGTVRERINEIDTDLWDNDYRDFYGYAIELSADGSTWTRVVDKLNTRVSGTQTDTFTKTDARYIRYVGRGSTLDDEFRVVEVDAYQGAADQAAQAETIDETLDGYAVVDSTYLLSGSVADIKKAVINYKTGVGTFESKFSRYSGAVPPKDIYLLVTTSQGNAVISFKVKSPYVLSAQIAVEKVGDYLSAANSIESGLMRSAIKYDRKEKSDFIIFTIDEMSPNQMSSMGTSSSSFSSSSLF
ncbi:MAG: discoidin domain-containing protein [archaeon]